MPHITLECSDNLIEKDLKPILAEIQIILVNRLPTQLAACQSRILKHAEYLIADGNVLNTFVHLSIQILPGRAETLLNSIAEEIIEHLKTRLQESLRQLNLQISVAIHPLPKVYHQYNV